MFDAGEDRDQVHRASYWDVRWSWVKKHELDELAGRFGPHFDVTKPEKTRPAFGQSILWEELLVRADNLSVLLSALRACFFQKHVQALTQRDKKLQSLVYELYPFTQHFFYLPIDLIIDLATRVKNRRGHAAITKVSD